MLYINVKLTFTQMITLGMHIGHTLQMSKFLSYWIYGGWRFNIFIINLIKTKFFLKIVMEAIEWAVLFCRPVWFINLDRKKSGYIIKFATLAGEPFCIYNWISGTLTNYRFTFNWYNILYSLALSDKYKMRHKDKIKVLGYFGFINHRKKIPGVGFVTSTNISWKAISEFWVMSIPCVGIVDSNVLSWNISLPIPGNDDSILCLNYYAYLVTRIIIYTKAWHAFFFNQNVKIIRKNIINYDFFNNAKTTKKLILLYFLLKQKHNKKLFLKELIKYKTGKDFVKNNVVLWNVNNFPVNLSVFNNVYTAFANKYFNKFYEPYFQQPFNTERDLIFHSYDPYRIS